MTEQPVELGVLLASCGERQLVLPGGMVAEIVSVKALEPAPEGSPAWLLGRLDWRGRSVPVVRIAGVPEMVPTPAQAMRNYLVVCFTPNGNASLPYLAIETRGLPRLERVTAAALTPEDEDGQPFALAAFRLNGHPALLPDVDALEEALLAIS